MNSFDYEHSRFNWKSITLAVVVFFLGCVALLWSWNTLATDLFDLPEARFKHAVAAGLLMMILGVFHSFATRNSSHRVSHDNQHGEIRS